MGTSIELKSFVHASIVACTSAYLNPMTIDMFEVSPLYVCTGETIHFEWDINNVDEVRIYRNGSHLIHSDDGHGSWTSGPVQSNWDYVRFKGCQDDNCEHVNFDVHIIDEPEWTRGYAADGPTSSLSGTIEIIGGPEVIDEEPDPASQSAEGLYRVYRMVDGYAINPRDDDFSPRARVLRVKPQGFDNALFPVDVDGMHVEASGMPRTWVPQGQYATLGAPISPRDRIWRLDYPTPQRVVVATQYGRLRRAKRTETDPSLYPYLTFYVKCLDA